MSTAIEHSALYRGRIAHRRHVPVEHAFSYPIAMLYLDLGELDAVFAQHPLWSASHAAPGRFRRGDQLGDPAVPLADGVRDAVAGQGYRRPEGPVRLLTMPRTYGRIFNPVSFYYCFDDAGDTVESVLADVSNTPWGERHVYVMEPSGGGSDKQFHVSPFMGMDHRYSWRLTAPGDTLAVGIASDREAERVFDARLTLSRRPLDRRALTSLLLRPPAAQVTLSRIYAQALRLKLKGAPYHPHPDR